MTRAARERVMGKWNKKEEMKSEGRYLGQKSFPRDWAGCYSIHEWAQHWTKFPIQGVAEVNLE